MPKALPRRCPPLPVAAPAGAGNGFLADDIGFAAAMRMVAEEHEAEVTALRAEVRQLKAQLGQSQGPRALPRPEAPAPTSPAPAPELSPRSPRTIRDTGQAATPQCPKLSPRSPRGESEEVQASPQEGTPPAGAAAALAAAVTRAEGPVQAGGAHTRAMSMLVKAKSGSKELKVSTGSKSPRSKAYLSSEASQAQGRRTKMLDTILEATASQRRYRSSMPRTFWQSLLRDEKQQMLVLDSVVGIVIVLNTAMIGVSTDLEPAWRGWLVVDSVFALFFLAEAVLKVLLKGLREYLCGADWSSNFFEAMLVFVAFLEIMLNIAKTSEGSTSGLMSLIRIVRLTRVTRILRVCRLDIFSDLKIMIRGTLGGMRTLFWSTVLIMLPLYAVCLILRETVGQIDEEGKGAEYFSSVPKSFFTVFRCVVAGECADVSGRPIFALLTEAYGWGFGAIYCVSIVFMSFGLYNVIVAIFVENVVSAAKTNDQLLKKQRLRDQYFFAAKIVELLEVIFDLQEEVVDVGRRATRGEASNIFDQASTLELTPEIFDMMRQDPRVQEIFGHLDVADEDQFSLFETLDADGSGTIDLEELCDGIAKLRGDARRSDIISLNFMIRNVQSELQSYTKSSMRRLYSQEEALRTVQAALLPK